MGTDHLRAVFAQGLFLAGNAIRSVIQIRAICGCLAGILLSGASVISHGETVPPITISKQLPERYYGTYGYGGFDPQQACVSITTAFYGNAYSGVGFRTIIPPRTVSCQGLYHGELWETTTFTHQWRCADGSNSQDVDVPLANCTKNVCPDNSTGTPANSPISCNCNKGYQPDLTGTSCIKETYTITLYGGTSTEPGTSLPFIAEVKNQDKQPPRNPVTIKISLKVDSKSGGHDHGDSTRPRGGIANVGTCPSDDTCWSLESPANSGVAVFNFNAPEASGTHTITATCDGCSNTETVDVSVKVNGLKPIPPSGLYALYETGGSAIGAVAGRHPSNHYLTAAAANRLLVIAINYHHFYPIDPVLHVNDASLMWGGVFDIDTEAEWSPPHEEHMRGTVVDIRANSRTGAIPTGNFESFIRLAKLRKVNAKIHSPGEANQHFHVRLLNRSE